MYDELVARAKADPEAFRRETVVALKTAGYEIRAELLEHTSSKLCTNDTLRGCMGVMPKHVASAESVDSAKAYRDALLQALTEMTPAERERLGW